MYMTAIIKSIAMYMPYMIYDCIVLNKLNLLNLFHHFSMYVYL